MRDVYGKMAAVRVFLRGGTSVPPGSFRRKKKGGRVGEEVPDPGASACFLDTFPGSPLGWDHHVFILRVQDSSQTQAHSGQEE